MKPVPPGLAKIGMRRLEDNRAGRRVAPSAKAFMHAFGDLLEARFLIPGQPADAPASAEQGATDPAGARR